jgi:hypothetical protein
MVIDVSGRAIEGTATIILEAIKDREELPSIPSSVVV